MSYVHVEDVQVVQPLVAPFLSPIAVDIVFELSQELKDDLEWKITYVGSADSEACDQELESVFVGPVPVGKNKFRLEAQHPDWEKIPKRDRFGVTVILVTCLYVGQEFFRVGFYVSNLPKGYEPPPPPETLPNEEGEEQEQEQEPAEVVFPDDISPEDVVRNINAEPRATTFQIDWEKEPEAEEESSMQEE